jgi:CHAD domain-containing protein
VKPRKVRGLDPGAALADNLEQIVAVRLDELCAFMPTAADPARVTELHDMRIAAKRLRYILEISHDLFGPYVTEATARTKALQTVLGDLHDCDMTLPQVLELIEEARAADVANVAGAARHADDLDPALLATAAPFADAHRGLTTMAVYLQARRVVLFARFLELWRDLEREGFRARLAFAIGERPLVPVPSPDEDAGAVLLDLPSE